MIWTTSLAGCMSQVLGAGALGRPRGIGWRGRWEQGSGWGIHVNPWLIHVNVWQKPLQYYKVTSLRLIKINEKKKNQQSDLESKMLEPCRDKWCLRQVNWMHLRCHYGWLWSSCKIPFGFLQSLMKLRRRLSFISHVVVQSPSLVWLFMTPWTEAHQAALSLTIS